MYRLPVLIVDSGSPALSSTNTLSVRVCDCDSDGVALSCGAVAYTATGLSTGALLAILGCILTLLGKIHHDPGVSSISASNNKWNEATRGGWNRGQTDTLGWPWCFNENWIQTLSILQFI